MYIFKFADIGEGIHDGKVTDVHVKVGDIVKDGTDLFSIETDKITTEISSPVNGKINKILLKVGDTIHVGDSLFEIEIEEKKEIEITKEEKQNLETKNFVDNNVVEDSASVVGEVKSSNNIMPIFGSNNVNNKVKQENKILASPVARLLAKENNISLHDIVGTGPNGRVLKDDIISIVSKKAISIRKSTINMDDNIINNPIETKTFVPVVEKDTVYEMTPIRKAISSSLKRSWNNVAYTNLSVEIDITDIWEQRNKVKDFVFETENIKLNLLPFVVKALAKALKLYPKFNALCDDQNNTLILKSNINIGIAVDTKDGLIVPNIKNADKLSILDIAKKISELAQKSRDKKISLEDIKNGTFSITNYGSLGVSVGLPVINYPEVAIAGLGMATSKIKKVGLNIVERKTMFLTIAADHRWLDGGDIARFANQVKQYLENFTLLFI